MVVESSNKASAPIPEAVLGPSLNRRGYHVGRVEANLYWVAEGICQSPFLKASDGVVLLDARPSISHNIRRAVDEVAAAAGATALHAVQSIRLDLGYGSHVHP
jgi:hypothetical protein